MRCKHFPDSGARAQPKLRGLWLGHVAIAALLVLPVFPVRATAEDPPAAPPAAAPAVAPPAPPQNLPVPPPQVIEAGSIPVTNQGENGAPSADEQPPTYANELPPPDDAPPTDARIDNPGTQLTAAPPKAPPVDGQWVYTSQYGWVWMPYSQSYTYVPSDGYPSMYLYGPTFGWRWVAAPWIYDYGPSPYWGTRGRVGFVWYSRPWFAHRGYVGPRYSYGPRYYSAPRYYGGRRGYSRGGGGRREVVVHGSGGGGHSHGGGGHSHGGRR